MPHGALNEDQVSRLPAMMSGVHSNLVAWGYREAPGRTSPGRASDAYKSVVFAVNGP